MSTYISTFMFQHRFVCSSKGHLWSSPTCSPISTWSSPPCSPSSASSRYPPSGPRWPSSNTPSEKLLLLLLHFSNGFQSIDCAEPNDIWALRGAHLLLTDVPSYNTMHIFMVDPEKLIQSVLQLNSVLTAKRYVSFFLDHPGLTLLIHLSMIDRFTKFSYS